MRTASAPLLALLNGSNAFRMCDLLQITLNDGTVLRYAGSDTEVTYAGQTYTTAVGFQRERTRMTRSLEVDSLNITLLTDGASTLAGVPFARAAADGSFDAARVKLMRAFFDVSLGALVDAIVLFEGEVADVDPGSTEVKMSVESELGRLNVKVPSNVIAPACNLTVFSAGCGVVKATFTSSKVAASGCTTTTVIMTVDAQVNDYYRLGVVTFTSGANIGMRRGVKGYVASTKTLTLTIPLPAAPTAGDTFNIYPGCDKTAAMCLARYNNLNRFRGFPYVPRPEDAR